MSDKAIVTACLIIIGNEILSGRTEDANLAFLGRQLNELGIRLAEARIIADDEAAIVEAVNQCRRRFDYVLTTGGIGPTHDDITSAAIAKAFGVSLERNAEALALLDRQYLKKDQNEARLKMADIPAGATLVENSVSRAPGYQIENVFVMAGVPKIMRAMFDDFKDRLKGGEKVLSETVTVFISEGAVAEKLAAVQARHRQVEIGSYPFVRDGKPGVSLVLRHTDAEHIEKAAADVREMLGDLGALPAKDLDG
ncbi:MAG: molybdopterin-binding protein [Rhodospirillales bacterium]|nr:molybdopterin-binding protein [Rhodospirillales bacterium]HIJ43181.1 competence/damage-inducible protein A [Rhodospirillaceae bacterium]HIJ92624.1 competence/damage-inducible protein A [Rhodospirillaceae bacterium]HJP54916.1 molybdopterin-binding protein [Rhodospirillales bacterium]